MYTIIILCRKYFQIVRFYYVYFGQINESVCLYIRVSVHKTDTYGQLLRRTTGHVLFHRGLQLLWTFMNVHTCPYFRFLEKDTGIYHQY